MMMGRLSNRNFSVTMCLIATCTFTLLAHAAPTVAPKNPKVTPYQGDGPDVSQNVWQNWQAPVSTVDPSRLISSDPADSTHERLPKLGFDYGGSNSLKVAHLSSGGRPIEVETTKPIESVESEKTETPGPTTPVLATAAPRPKSGSKRVIVLAICAVAFVAYRKFRRASARPYPPKPNFL
jgi:hypothetical protein